MTTYVLLYQLRQRLALVQARIAEHERMTNDADSNSYHQLHAAGALSELRSEQLFVAGLIDDIETCAVVASEVTP
jgi:hypothetical protein